MSSGGYSLVVTTVHTTAARKTTAPILNEYSTESGMPLAITPDDTERRKQIGQRIRQRLADADEKALHHKTERALFFRQFVGNKSAKRFHRDVDAGVENPEQTRGHPDGRRVGMKKSAMLASIAPTRK